MRGWWLVFLLGSLEAQAGSKTLKGVSMSDTLEVSGKVLSRNGMGLRRRFVFDVYVAALYVETPSRDAPALVSSGQVKVVELEMLRDVSRQQLVDALRDPIEANSKANFDSLKVRLDRFAAALPALKKGARLRVVCEPGRGVRVEQAKVLVEIEGDDFAQAVLRAWLGARPADDGLKQALLGQAD